MNAETILFWFWIYNLFYNSKYKKKMIMILAEPINFEGLVQIFKSTKANQTGHTGGAEWPVVVADFHWAPFASTYLVLSSRVFGRVANLGVW